MQAVVKEAQHNLDNAKVQLICRPDSIFITTVLLSLKFEWDSAIPTACTNGLYMKINPDFFNGLTKDVRIFVLAHEAYHVALQHMTRVGEKQFKLWNIACDYVINLMLKDSGFVLWSNALIDEKYRTLTSEEVYALLLQQPESSLPDSPEDMEQAEGTPEQLADIQEQITDTIVRAAVKAKMENQAGSIPGEILVQIDKLLNPRLPWYTILAKHLNAMAKNDYTYKRLNRRYLPDMFMPTLYSEALGDIAVAVDTSCSVTDEQFTAFISEIDSINKSTKPERIDVIGFSTEITCQHVIHEATDIAKIEFKGRGGTRIQPVYEWTKTNKPNALVIFTDGYFRLFEEDIPRGIPIYWIIYGRKDFKTNKGKIIYYEA